MVSAACCALGSLFFAFIVFLLLSSDVASAKSQSVIVPNGLLNAADEVIE